MSTEKKWYVYMLCDPDTEEPFYIGKGSGNRMHYHERVLNNRSDVNTAKKEAIRKILAQGKQVLKKKVAEFDDQSEAYAYEVALIKQYRDQLTNIKPGGGRLVYPAKPPKEPVKRGKRGDQKYTSHRPSRVYTLDDPYIPVEQVAQLLGWSKEKLEQAIKKLDIKKHKFLFHVYKWIAREDIELLKESKPRMGPPPGPRGPRRQQAAS